MYVPFIYSLKWKSFIKEVYCILSVLIKFCQHSKNLTDKFVNSQHFGKRLRQEEAKEVFRRATSVKQAVHIKPAKGREWSQDKTSFHADTFSTDEFLDLWHEPASSAGPPEDLDIDLGSLPVDEQLPVSRAA